MKIAMLNTADRQGGAAVAASRLKEALVADGIEVRLIVRNKVSPDPEVISINTGWFHRKINRFRFLWERLMIYLSNGFSREKLFMVSIADTGRDVSRLPEVRQADIIHLHWVNQGFLSLDDIRKLLALGKPVVWTLHDMWPVTGICHHAWECERFRFECGQCPFLNSSRKNDLSTRIFRKKHTLYTGSSLSLVPVSEWLRKKCAISGLTRDLRAVSIPNPIDTDFFCPGEKEPSRKTLNLPADKKIWLLGAARIDDPVKGFSYLKEALRLLDPSIARQVVLVLFGGIKHEAETLADIPVQVQWRRQVTDPEEIRLLYRSADYFLAPSVEDNLPNTVMESLSCGTPVIGFRTGGIPEMVDHKQNGYLAPRKDTAELAEGLKWGITEAPAAELSAHARQKVLSCYTVSAVTARYRKLYADLLR